MVNGPILSELFQAGGNHEIWHKDAFNGGEFKLIRSHVKSDVRTISGGFMFLSICLLVKIKMSNFLIFRFAV